MTNNRHIGARKKFRVYLWFVGWDCLALGLSCNYRLPDIEIHLPFCFIKIGWEKQLDNPAINGFTVEWREKSLI